MDAHSLFLTPNTESVYIMTCSTCANGPVVVESPPNTLGMVNDFFFRYVSDMGNAGPDRGKGGKYLYLPPDWEGRGARGLLHLPVADLQEPDVLARLPRRRRSRTRRSSRQDAHQGLPAGRPADGARGAFVNVSGQSFNTIHANDIHFYDRGPGGHRRRARRGLQPGDAWPARRHRRSRRDEPFAPDDRMKGILEEAVAVGNATARASRSVARDPRAFYYEDSAWFTAFVGGSHEFLRESGARDLDARTMFHYPYTAVTPAMAMEIVGVGSQYAIASVDANGDYLDGSKTYSLTLPAGIPAKDFWSFVNYDPQTRSMLQTPARRSRASAARAGRAGQCRRQHDDLVRPEAAARQGVQLGPDRARQGLVHGPAPLRARWSRGSIRPGGRARSKSCGREGSRKAEQGGELGRPYGRQLPRSL